MIYTGLAVTLFVVCAVLGAAGVIIPGSSRAALGLAAAVVMAQFALLLFVR